MLRLIRLILLIAAFVGGYQVGRLPGAPDLTPYLQAAYHKALEAGEKIKEAGQGDPNSTIRTSLLDKFSVDVGGRTYRVAGVDSQQ